jgi:hypothetical protein
MRLILRKQNQEDRFPESFFAPAAILRDYRFPWPESFGQVAP